MVCLWQPDVNPKRARASYRKEEEWMQPDRTTLLSNTRSLSVSWAIGCECVYELRSES
jgi:hypothetical protein